MDYMSTQPSGGQGGNRLPTVIGAVLIVAGLLTGGWGLTRFMEAFSNPMLGSPLDILIMAAGGFMLIFGLGALKPSRGRGQITSPQGPTQIPSGWQRRSCEACGTAAEPADRFCSSCGAELR